MNPLSLSIISFLTGFALMVFELVAARLLAPSIGSSIYVWTSVIGIIIAALSIGYWAGGKLADIRQKPSDIVVLCLVTALLVACCTLSYPSLLSWVSQSIEDARLQGVIASLILFAPTSLVLGLLSPYLAKLNITTLETAGESVANLSALNSIGGIVGTFITGFVLFSYIGSKETLIIVVLCLILSSWLIAPKKRVVQRGIASILLISLMLLPTPIEKGVIANIDSPSAHYTVRDMRFNDRPITALSTGPGGIQSAVYTDTSSELVFWYTIYAAKLIAAQKPERVLILGGGAFTLPAALADALPTATIDAVEIDHALEPISKQYFSYEDRNNVRLVFEDARSFINTNITKYDVIFVDVYGDSYVPFSLMTQEFGQNINNSLAEDGVVVINAVAGSTTQCQALLGAIDAVYRPFLPHAFWQTQEGTETPRGNYILAYSRNSQTPLQMKPLSPISNGTLYTDNFMPAERLNYQCAQSA
jgi:predicted membrane-bound spermidine synthase